MSWTLKLNLLNSFTILHSTFLSFFVSNNFADIFDDKAIFTDRFESLDTPSTAIAGAKNTELQLMFTKYGYYSFQIDLNEIYNNTHLWSPLNYSIWTLWSTTAPTVTFIDGRTYRDLKATCFCVCRLCTGHWTAASFSSIDTIETFTTNNRIVRYDYTFTSLKLKTKFLNSVSHV